MRAQPWWIQRSLGSTSGPHSDLKHVAVIAVWQRGRLIPQLEIWKKAQSTLWEGAGQQSIEV